MPTDPEYRGTVSTIGQIPDSERRLIASNRGHYIQCVITGNGIFATETIPGVVNAGDHLELNESMEVIESRNPPVRVYPEIPREIIDMAASGTFSIEEIRDAMGVPEGLIRPPGRMETRSEMLERTSGFRFMAASGLPDQYASTTSGWMDFATRDQGDRASAVAMSAAFMRDFYQTNGLKLTIPEPPTRREFQDPPELFEDRTREDMVIMEDGLLKKAYKRLKLMVHHHEEDSRDVIIDD